MKLKKKKKELTPQELELAQSKSFFDMICPGSVQYHNDYYTVGDSFRSVWAIKEYPPETDEQALLSRLGNHTGVTLRCYHRHVEDQEQRQIVDRAKRRNMLKQGSSNLSENIEASENLQDIMKMLGDMHRQGQSLVHCAVFLELRAKTLDGLKELQGDMDLELTRSKIVVDHLWLRQKEGFLSVLPFGFNQFGTQFERVLPSGSVANLYPYNYAGKTDPQGFYIGRDRYGTNIVVDIDRITDDKTCPSVLILGNPGQGKSHLVKYLLVNLREAGKPVICLDAESEYSDLCRKLNGCILDLMSGEYCINPLEPKAWTTEPVEERENAPLAFKRATRLSQHIAFLRDFFASYKDFTCAQLDVIEILLSKLYDRFGITDRSDLDQIQHTRFPIMEDLYNIGVETLTNFDPSRHGELYTEDTLREVCLGLHSMCVGSASCYFNGHTNITSSDFLVFGVQGIMDTNKRLRDTILFNIISYMSNELLVRGNSVAAVDELYLFLNNPTIVEYIRNMMKRARKRDSLLILSSQNVEDFLLPSVQTMTKPLFSTPSHRFLFHPGACSETDYMAALQINASEFALIKDPERRKCLYCCGNERYFLEVITPDYKMELFGKAGGR